MEHTKHNKGAVVVGSGAGGAIAHALAAASLTTNIVAINAPERISRPTRERLAATTFIQELAILMLAGQPLADSVQTVANKNRKKLMAALNEEERELYRAGQAVLLDLAGQLARCQNLEMVAKVLQIVQGITTGSIAEYAEIESRIIDPQTTI